MKCSLLGIWGVGILLIFLFFSCKWQNTRIQNPATVVVSDVTTEKPEIQSFALRPVELNENDIIDAIYPDYFQASVDESTFELRGIPIFSKDRSEEYYFIEDVRGYSIDEERLVIAIHWIGTGLVAQSVSQFYVVKKLRNFYRIESRQGQEEWYEYGGGTSFYDLPVPDSLYYFSEEFMVMGIGQSHQFEPSNSLVRDYNLIRIGGSQLNSIFRFNTFDGYAGFRLNDMTRASQRELINMVNVIPNPVYRNEIEETSSRFRIGPTMTNGYFDLYMTEEHYSLDEEFRQVRYRFEESVFQYNGTHYREAEKVDS